VRGVPIDWDADRLQSYIAEQHASANPTIGSLCNEIDGRSLTATVSFRSPPDSLRTAQSGRILPATGNQFAPQRGIKLDDGFLGITTLFSPVPEDHKIE